MRRVQLLTAALVTFIVLSCAVSSVGAGTIARGTFWSLTKTQERPEKPVGVQRGILTSQSHQRSLVYLTRLGHPRFTATPSCAPYSGMHFLRS
jgi:hypothetical protein